MTLAITAMMVFPTATFPLEMQTDFAQALPPPPRACEPFALFFEAGTAALRDEALLVISEAVRIGLRRQSRAFITGHTDGLEGDDRALSETRAAAVRQEMVRQGFSTEKIEISGMGFTVPFLPTAIGIGEPLNRRAVIDGPCRNG